MIPNIQYSILIVHVLSCLFCETRAPFRLSLSKYIRLESSRLYAPLKHDVQLFVRPSFHLWHPEPAPKKARQAQPTEEEAEFSPQRCLIGIDKVRDGDSHDDPNHGLDGRRNSDSLGPHTRGGNLTKDRVGYGSDATSCQSRTAHLGEGKLTSSQT
jgi:hypothetical protein